MSPSCHQLSYRARGERELRSAPRCAPDGSGTPIGSGPSGLTLSQGLLPIPPGWHRLQPRPEPRYRPRGAETPGRSRSSPRVPHGGGPGDTAGSRGRHRPGVTSRGRLAWGGRCTGAGNGRREEAPVPTRGPGTPGIPGTLCTLGPLRCGLPHRGVGSREAGQGPDTRGPGSSSPRPAPRCGLPDAPGMGGCAKRTPTEQAAITEDTATPAPRSLRSPVGVLPLRGGTVGVALTGVAPTGLTTRGGRTGTADRVPPKPPVRPRERVSVGTAVVPLGAGGIPERYRRVPGGQRGPPRPPLALPPALPGPAWAELIFPARGLCSRRWAPASSSRSFHRPGQGSPRGDRVGGGTLHPL